MLNRLRRASGSRSNRSLEAGCFFEQLEKREVFDVTVNNAISDIVQPTPAPITINLLGRYTDNGVTQIVRLVTSAGNIDIALSGNLAPNTVANFLQYVTEGFYNGTIFHRSQRPTPSVNYGLIQGGGFSVPTTNFDPTGGLPLIATNQPQPMPTGPNPGQVHGGVNLEHPTGNFAYTLGLARTSDPNSGTSQFYINTTDNTDVFDAAVNPPGYATFGTVLQLTRETVDTINGFTYYDAYNNPAQGHFGPFPNGALTNLPLDWDTEFPLEPSHYITITGASVVTDLEDVETAVWSASVTSNAALISSIAISHDGELSITPATTGTRGTATVRLRANSADGASFVDDTFTIQIDNFAPMVGGFQGQSNVAVGGTMLLNAFGVRDGDVGAGGVASVAFWFDADGDGELDPEVDTQLSNDTNGANGWGARVSTSMMEAGQNRIFVRVTDTDGATATEERMITLRSGVPDSGLTPEVTSTPGGFDVDLGFNEGLPSNTGIRRISMFIDSDNDGFLNPLSDRLIGHATFSNGAWGFTVDAGDLELGANRVFARVTDNYGNLGGLSSSSITVES